MAQAQEETNSRWGLSLSQERRKNAKSTLSNSTIGLSIFQSLTVKLGMDHHNLKPMQIKFFASNESGRFWWTYCLHGLLNWFSSQVTHTQHYKKKKNRKRKTPLLALSPFSLNLSSPLATQLSHTQPWKWTSRRLLGTGLPTHLSGNHPIFFYTYIYIQRTTK